MARVGTSKIRICEGPAVSIGSWDMGKSLGDHGVRVRKGSWDTVDTGLGECSMPDG